MNEIKSSEVLIKKYRSEGRSNAVEDAVRNIIKPKLAELTSGTDYYSLDTSLSFKRRLLDIVSSANESDKLSNSMFEDIETLLDMAIECTEISPHMEGTLPML